MNCGDKYGCFSHYENSRVIIQFLVVINFGAVENINNEINYIWICFQINLNPLVNIRRRNAKYNLNIVIKVFPLKFTKTSLFKFKKKISMKTPLINLSPTQELFVSIEFFQFPCFCSRFQERSKLQVLHISRALDFLLVVQKILVSWKVC